MEESGRFQTLDGQRTHEADPRRGIWYSASCTYWTDDWTTLKRLELYPIPACPHCGSPGLQTTAEEWDTGVRNFATSHPHYAEFVDSLKSAPCQRLVDGHGYTDLYSTWVSTRN